MCLAAWRSIRCARRWRTSRRWWRAPCTPYEAENALAHRETLAYLAGGDGRCFALGHSADVITRAAALRRLFAGYAGRATITRVPPTDWAARLDEQNASVAVVYPTYTKRDIVALAQAGAVLPAGITRHVIPGRALRINVPIDYHAAGREAGLARRLAARAARRPRRALLRRADVSVRRVGAWRRVGMQ